MQAAITPKQRMLNAYRGLPNDRVAVAPEFWYYYPAKVLGVDMIRFQREIPFHLALKQTFEKFQCDGWGIVSASAPDENCQCRNEEKWVSEGVIEVRSTIKTPKGNLKSAVRYDRMEPGWTTERPVKDLARDLPAYEQMALADPKNSDFAPAIRAWQDVGESFLLEFYIGVPFFDFFAGAREGGFETAIFDFVGQETMLAGLQERYLEYMREKTKITCENTPFESLFIGCAWSCNSLIGPAMWRRWDKPVIKTIVDTAHKHGRLVHVHFHGRCLETVADFAELGIDCVCPFERPPGGDIVGLEGLKNLRSLLNDQVTMNGNVHTVETLIRGAPDDVRREVREIKEAFQDSPRVIIGTGDQVGRETPEENLFAMIAEAKIIFR